MHGLDGDRQETILVVDDADSIRKMICSMLSFSGYHCLEAEDGMEALRVVKRDPECLDLLLTDIMMPNMGGAELAREVAGLCPDLPILFMSGYSDDTMVQSLERSPALFLPKPFTATALTEKVRSALDRPWHGLAEARIGTAT
jgi:CheY-like chemotaxis protein